MSYPYSYDTIEEIDLAECALYAHVMTDGIIETADSISMGATYCVFARYGSGTPLVSIIDPQADMYLCENETGSYQDKTGLWKFCINIPTKYAPGSDPASAWMEGHAILKLYSDESPLMFQKHVEVIAKACSTAEMCATMDNVIASLEIIKETDKSQDKVLTTLKNGWKVIH